MNTATIQVQYVNQPKQAHWKSGSIKDANGQRFSIDKQFLGYFQPGETCDILWEQVGQYPTIVGKGGQTFPHNPQPAPGSAVSPSQPRNANWPQPPQTNAPVPDKAADTAEQIFITGVVGRAMGSGQFIAADIPELTRTARYAWETRGKLGSVQYNEAEHAKALEKHSPAHQARSDIDSQYGNQHPNMTDIPMTEAGDPGPFGGG